MKRLGAALLWAAAVAGAAGCSQFSFGPEQPPLGYVVFDSYKQETSFRFTLDGICVDIDGVVWRYHSDKPWLPEELRLGQVSESDMMHKMEGAERVGTVTPDVMEEMIALIGPAGAVEVTRDMQSFERDGSVDVAYRFDATKKSYEQVVLSGTGTWAARNPSPEARQLLRHLDDIKHQVGFE